MSFVKIYLQPHKKTVLFPKSLYPILYILTSKHSVKAMLSKIDKPQINMAPSGRELAPQATEGARATKKIALSYVETYTQAVRRLITSRCRVFFV